MHFSTLPPRPLEHTVKSLQGKDFSLIGCECYWLYRQLSKHKTKPNLTSNFITIQSKGLWAVEVNKQLRERHFPTSFRTPPESRIQTAPPISNTLTLEGAQVMYLLCSLQATELGHYTKITDTCCSLGKFSVKLRSALLEQHSPVYWQHTI